MAHKIFPIFLLYAFMTHATITAGKVVPPRLATACREKRGLHNPTEMQGSTGSCSWDDPIVTCKTKNVEQGRVWAIYYKSLIWILFGHFGLDSLTKLPLGVTTRREQIAINCLGRVPFLFECGGGVDGDGQPGSEICWHLLLVYVCFLVHRGRYDIPLQYLCHTIFWGLLSVN